MFGSPSGPHEKSWYALGCAKPPPSFTRHGRGVNVSVPHDQRNRHAIDGGHLDAERLRVGVGPGHGCGGGDGADHEVGAVFTVGQRVLHVRKQLLLLNGGSEQ